MGVNLDLSCKEILYIIIAQGAAQLLTVKKRPSVLGFEVKCFYVNPGLANFFLTFEFE